MSQSNQQESLRKIAERGVARGTKFLGTLSRSPDIRRVLEQAAGYSEEDHDKGWNLLLTVMGYRQGPPPPSPERPLGQTAAIAELDQWDAPAFERTRAALDMRFPEQSAFIFSGLSAGNGAAAVGTVKTFLDRVAILRKGRPDAPEATRDADRAAAALIAKRRIVDEKIEEHLRSLISRATQLAPAAAAEPAMEDSPEYQAAVMGLQAWLNDWRAQARNVIRRRDQLINLGIGARKTGSADDEEETPDAPEGTAQA